MLPSLATSLVRLGSRIGAQVVLLVANTTREPIQEGEKPTVPGLGIYETNDDDLLCLCGFFFLSCSQ